MNVDTEPSGTIMLRCGRATMCMAADGTFTLASRAADGQTAMLVLSAVDGVRFGTAEEAATFLLGDHLEAQ